MQIEIESSGMSTLLSMLSALSGDAMRPLMNDLAKQIHESVLLNFIQQRTPDGVPWLPSQAAIRENRLTLVDTARLYDSIRYDADNQTAVVGTDVEYAERMHFGGGTGYGSAYFEGRPFLGIRDENELEKTVSDYFEGLLS